MPYKRVVVVLYVLANGLSVSGMSLKDLAAKEVLKKGSFKILKEAPRDIQYCVGEFFCKENLPDSWMNIPEKQILKKRLNSSDKIRGVAFIGLSDFSVSIHRDGMIRFWDYTNSTLDGPLKELEAKQESLTQFAITGDGRFMATAGGKSIKIWELTIIKNNSLGSCYDTIDIQLIKALVAKENVSALAFDDSGRYVSAGDTSGSAFLWDLKQKDDAPIFTCHHTKYSYNSGILNRIHLIWTDGEKLLSARDTCINVWDSKKNECIKEVTVNHTALLSRMHRKGSIVYSCFTDGKLFLTDIKRGTSFGRKLSKHGIESSEISEDGRFLLTGHQDSMVRLWKTEDYSFIQEFKVSDCSYVTHVALKNDGCTLLCGDCFGRLDIWTLDRTMKNLTLNEAKKALKKAKLVK